MVIGGRRWRWAHTDIDAHSEHRMEAAIVISAGLACIAMLWKHRDLREWARVLLWIYLVAMAFPGSFAIGFCMTKSDANPEFCGILCVVLLAIGGLAVARTQIVLAKPERRPISFGVTFFATILLVAVAGGCCGVLVAPRLTG